jgi:branched-chain amino acid transport system substrate-binding protein
MRRTRSHPGAAFIGALLIATLLALGQAMAAQPIKIAIDAEFGIPGSTSAQAIRNGAQVAVDEINGVGGVLGRPLEIVQRDNLGMPARASNNLRELAHDPDVVAVLCGKYSPVVVDLLPEIHRLEMPYLNPWAAADPITEHGFRPDYVFRLSLRDTWALRAMMEHADRQGIRKLGLLLPNSDWGRSSLRAAQRLVDDRRGPKIAGFEWYNFGEQSLASHYRNLRAAGAQAILLVANEQEGAVFVNELASLPEGYRLPVLAHWGITGGRFFEMTRDSLQDLDLVVVQTFTFLGRSDPEAVRLLRGLERLTGNGDPRKVESPVGVAHAYDLVHLLARAIEKSGSTDRAGIRDALEHLGPYQGVTRRFERPFAPGRHEALRGDEVFMARFAADGAIEPLGAGER